MSLTRYLIIAVFSGGLTCFLSQFVMLFCYFTYEWVGKYIYLPFYWFAVWPNVILQAIASKSFLERFYADAWPASVLASFIGWIIFALSIGFAIAKLTTLNQSLHPTPQSGASEL
jgi:hypothetical protein